MSKISDRIRLLGELNGLIQKLLKSGPLSGKDAAAKLVDLQPDLWNSVSPELALERLAGIAATSLARIARPAASSPDQMPLPGMEHAPILIPTGQKGKGLTSAAQARIEQVDARITRLVRLLKRKEPITTRTKLKLRRERIRAELREWQQARKVMAHFSTSNPDITLEEAIYRQPEYEDAMKRWARERKKKTAKARAGKGK